MASEAWLTQQVEALEQALELSGWFGWDRAARQAALYAWAESGMPVDEASYWIDGGIVRPEDALAFQERLVTAEMVLTADVGEQVSAGKLSIDDAARLILRVPATDFDGIRAIVQAEALDAEEDRAVGVWGPPRLGEGEEPSRILEWPWWRRQRLARLWGLLADHAVPAAWSARLQEQPDDVLLAARKRAAERWGGPLTIAVARRELRQFDGSRPISKPLAMLIAGSLAAYELRGRLGERLRAMLGNLPPYLTATLGPYPASTAAQPTWEQAALALEEFRLEYQISDPDWALGDPHIPMPPNQLKAYRELDRALTGIRATLDRGDPVGIAAFPDKPVVGGLPPARTRVTGAPLVPPELVQADADPPHVRLRSYLLDLSMVLLADEQSASAFALQEAAAGGLSDAELRARWHTAMAYSLGRELGDPTLPAPAPLVEAAAIVEELHRRLELQVEAVTARPPAYIHRELGPSPAEVDAARLAAMSGENKEPALALPMGEETPDDILRRPPPPDVGRIARESERMLAWELMVAEIEEYRLLTGTSDPAFALGAPMAPDGSWQQCWRRDVALELTNQLCQWSDYRQHVLGTQVQGRALADVLGSIVGPGWPIRPSPAMVADAEALAADHLHRRVAAAAALLADRPANRAADLAEAKRRRTQLLGYRDAERAALAASHAEQARVRWAISRAGRAARRAASASVDEHAQTLSRLERQLGSTGQEVVDLERAQTAYSDWCTAQVVELTRGQAAAQELHARQTRLLHGLACYPPLYLSVELGNPPTNPHARAAWLGGAVAVERYRATYQIDDEDNALGDTGAYIDHPAREAAVRHLREVLDQARRTIIDSLIHELDQGLVLPDLGDDPPGLVIEP